MVEDILKYDAANVGRGIAKGGDPFSRSKMVNQPDGGAAMRRRYRSNMDVKNTLCWNDLG